MPQSFRKRISFLLKLLVSGGFVAWVVFEVNWLEVMGRIAAINIPALLVYLSLLVAGMAISARKWQRIFLFKGFVRPFKDAFLAYLTGTLINNFLPSFIGGDTYRGLWLGKKDGRFSPAISTLLFDRFTGLWAAMVFTLLFSLFHIETVLAHPIWILLDIGIMCSLSIDFLFPYFEKFSILRFLASKLPERIQYLFQELGGFAHRDILIPSLKLSLLFNAIGVGAANIVLFHALGGDVRILDYLGVIFLVSIVSSFPISVNNIGLKEWAYITFFGYLGVEAETAIAVAITSRFLQMLVSFFAIPFYFRSRDMIESWKQKELGMQNQENKE